MIRLILFCTTLQFVQSTCPDGFDLVRDGECRGKYTTIDTFQDQIANDVIATCKEIDAKPIIIHNEEHQSYWTDRAASNGIWTTMGLVCNESSKQWEWADGSALDFIPPRGSYYPGVLDKSCNATFANWVIWEDGYWTYWDYEHFSWSTDVFCTTQLTQPIPNGDRCEGFDDDSEDGVCYQIGGDSENWQDGQRICRSLGADLPSVHNAQENAFIRRLAVSKGAVGGVFLGAILSGKGNEYGWIDGSTWDYDNFNPDFPMVGRGSCIAMNTSSSTGEWMNSDCSTKLPVACIRKARKTSEPTCSAGPWKENQMIISPGYPYNASIPCDFTLLVEEGKKVELKIISLEANKCCDNLNIYDSGNQIANLSGEISNATYTSKTNSMRVSWKPEGGVNVRGVAMMFRGV